MELRTTPIKINKRTKAGKASLLLQEEYDLTQPATDAIYLILKDWGKRKKAPMPDWMPHEECIDIWNEHHKKHNDGAGAEWGYRAINGMKGILKQIYKRLKANDTFKDKPDGEIRDQIMTSFSWICETRDKFPSGEFFFTWDLSLLNSKFSDFYRKLSQYGAGNSKHEFQSANGRAVRAKFSSKG